MHLFPKVGEVRRRLRKKKHLGEFREFSVSVRIGLSPGTNFYAFLDDWITNAVEANGLQFGGGGRADEIDGVVELGRIDVCRNNLAKIEHWLANHDSVKSFQIGELFDGWHLEDESR